MKVGFGPNDPMGRGGLSSVCGAKTRQGGRCGQVPMANGRCYFHGGKSTGPRTIEGLERMRAAKTKHGWHSDDGRQLREMIRLLRKRSKAAIELC